MTLPYYNPGHRSLAFALWLLLTLTLLVLTGLGVFRLYFGFEWTAGSSESGQLFTLNVRGGQSFNLFEVEYLGPTFWSNLLILALLCLLMPLFRLTGACFLAFLATLALILSHHQQAMAATRIPLEFELLSVVVLLATYVLLSYMGEVRDRKRAQQLLSQYVPAELVREYQRDPDSLYVSGDQRDITVLFCDVVGFSAICEQLSPRELADWLNLFFEHVSRVVVRNQGAVDKYMGDSVMAVWGALQPSRTHAFDALNAGMAIQAELDELNRRYAQRKLPLASIGIGISTGQAMVGPLGSEYRVDYTVVGDDVNVAQRLETLTRKYQVPVIVSDRTAAELPDMVFRELDTVSVKGRSQPVTMFEPLGQREALDASILERVALHEAAIQASQSGDWETAKTLFMRLREEWGPASMYDFYLHGIEQARRR